MDNQKETNDHDLLIELRTEMKGIRAELKEMRENTIKRLETVENQMIDKNDLEEHKKNDYAIHEEFIKVDNDHETRIRRLEYITTLGIGGIAVLELVLKFLVK